MNRRAFFTRLAQATVIAAAPALFLPKAPDRYKWVNNLWYPTDDGIWNEMKRMADLERTLPPIPTLYDFLLNQAKQDIRDAYFVYGTDRALSETEVTAYALVKLEDYHQLHFYRIDHFKNNR